MNSVQLPFVVHRLFDDVGAMFAGRVMDGRQRVAVKRQRRYLLRFWRLQGRRGRAFLDVGQSIGGRVAQHATATAGRDGAANGASATVVATDRAASNVPTRESDYVAWLTPRIPGHPWTAPAYDELNVPTISRVSYQADLRDKRRAIRGIAYYMDYMLDWPEDFLHNRLVLALGEPVEQPRPNYYRWVHHSSDGVFQLSEGSFSIVAKNYSPSTWPH